MKIVTPKQMKLLEATADHNGISYEQLMLNAGNILADEISKKTTSSDRILFLCGNGNNAGDCFVASKILLEKYSYNRIIIALLCGLSKKMFNAMDNNISIISDYNGIKSNMQDATLICDGIFGTGFHGEISNDIQDILKTPHNAYVLAVDIPSGVDCTSGRVSTGTLKANETLTFAFKMLNHSVVT